MDNVVTKLGGKREGGGTTQRSTANVTCRDQEVDGLLIGVLAGYREIPTLYGLPVLQ